MFCPGCFAEKPDTPVCPHCGYDESLKRSPLVLPHHTMLNQGRYRVGRVLGKPGGFGITYLGWDERLQTKVALKEYLPRELAGRDVDHRTVSAHSGEDAAAFAFGLGKFLEEARTLARLDHPNLVRVRDFFEEHGTAYLVMDYYDGLTLAEYLTRQPGGKIGEEQAIGVLLPILDGLREVHAKGFLHRDIKPANIYLTAGNRPILLDFGAARQAMGEHSRSLSVVLSEGYAPLEQYQRNGQQGPWTDVYGAAATLYTMLTGQVPPSATDRIHDDQTCMEGLSHVSATVREAIRQGMSPESRHRSQNLPDWQTKLHNAVGGESLPDAQELPGKGTETRESVSAQLQPEAMTPNAGTRKIVKVAALIFGLVMSLYWLIDPSLPTRPTRIASSFREPESPVPPPAGETKDRVPAIQPNAPGQLANQEEIILGRCHMDACWWWKVNAKTLLREKGEHRLFQLIVQTASREYPGGNYPEHLPQVSELTWEAPEPHYVFCSNRLPVTMAFDPERKHYLARIPFDSDGQPWGFSEGDSNLYYFVCHGITDSSKIVGMHFDLPSADSPNDEIVLDAPADILDRLPPPRIADRDIPPPRQTGGNGHHLIDQIINLSAVNGGNDHAAEIQGLIQRLQAQHRPNRSNKGNRQARQANQQAIALIKENKLLEAEALLLQAVRQAPEEEEYLNNLGYLYYLLGQLDQAQESLYRTLAVAPTRSAAWANLGQVYAHRQAIDKAVACFASSYRFSRNRGNTIKFFQDMNATEAHDGLRTAREQFLSWASRQQEKTADLATATGATTARDEPPRSKSWHADWGNDIRAHVTHEPCPVSELINKGYPYLNIVDIPKSRLKDRRHAWGISGDRAVTVVGCWHFVEGSYLHTVMHRKKDGKVWEQDLNVGDGSWYEAP